MIYNDNAKAFRIQFHKMSMETTLFAVNIFSVNAWMSIKDQWIHERVDSKKTFYQTYSKTSVIKRNSICVQWVCKVFRWFDLFD